jgi:hypothetical protein
MLNSAAIIADPTNAAAARGTPKAITARCTPPRSASLASAATTNIPPRSSRAANTVICSTSGSDADLDPKQNLRIAPGLGPDADLVASGNMAPGHNGVDDCREDQARGDRRDTRFIDANGVSL